MINSCEDDEHDEYVSEAQVVNWMAEDTEFRPLLIGTMSEPELMLSGPRALASLQVKVLLSTTSSTSLFSLALALLSFKLCHPHQHYHPLHTRPET